MTYKQIRVTTIIPTLCEISRKNSILRAIESVTKASKESVRILIVVNGQRYDPELLQILSGRSDLDVLQIQEGSLTLAHKVGRDNIGTEFFSFLDDDDEYLPGAIDRRLVIIDSNPLIDLVVSNGFIHRNGVDEILYSRMVHVPNDPLRELFKENWLHNCNALFRTSSVTKSYFEAPHKYMEWTWLAFRLALDGKRVATSNGPAFRYHDTPGSLSKSLSFSESRISLYRRMLSLTLPSDVANTIRRRLSSAWHDISDIQRREGLAMLAIQSHFYSIMAHPTGLRYIPFTRHLFSHFLGKRKKA